MIKEKIVKISTLDLLDIIDVLKEDLCDLNYCRREKTMGGIYA